MNVARPSLIAFFLGLVFASPAKADFDAGFLAYERGDFKTAAKEWRPAASKGDPHAQHMLGFLYARGRGVPLSPEQTVKLWHQAAEQGFAPAQYTLGTLYREGMGVKQDLDKAVKWISRAADGGYPDAQFDFGVMHVTGEGVDKDLSMAFMWIGLAAETRGFEPARMWASIDKLLTPAQRLEADQLKKTWQ